MTEIQLIIYSSSWLEHLTVNQRVLGSSPRGGASNTVTLHILNLREIGGFFFYRYITKNLLKYIKSWQLLGNCNNLLKFLLDFIPFYIEKELSQYPF